VRRLLVGGLMGLCAACATLPPPPLLGPSPPRRSLEARYAKMRIRVGEFHDRTTLLGGVSGYDTGPFFRSADALVNPQGLEVAMGVDPPSTPPTPRVGHPPGPAVIQTIPDALAGIIGQSGRFELLATSNEPCDAVLVGGFTAVKDMTASLELRLVSCAYEADMASVTVPLRIEKGDGVLVPSRDDLMKAVLAIVGELPDPRDIRPAEIVSRRGNVVTINVGSADRVVKGMTAFARAPSDPVLDPRTNEVIKDQIITGDLYIFAVSEKSSTAYIVNEYPSVTLVGDSVEFK
jgi:hypothetical protein